LRRTICIACTIQTASAHALHARNKYSLQAEESDAQNAETIHNFSDKHVFTRLVELLVPALKEPTDSAKG
jgi:hypothetical protein